MNTLIFVEQLFKQQYVAPKTQPDIRNTWVGVPNISILSPTDYFCLGRLEPDIANKQILGTISELEHTKKDYTNLSVTIFKDNIGKGPLISILGECKEKQFPGVDIAFWLYENCEKAVSMYPWLAEGNQHILPGSQICGYGKHWYMMSCRYQPFQNKFAFGFNWIGSTLGYNDIHILS